MADMVTNLLDMARIQSGEVRLRLDWQSMEEIIGGAVKHAQGALGSASASAFTSIPAVSLVECDAVLIERVLANLLENAGKYTPGADGGGESWCARRMRRTAWSACVTMDPGCRKGPGGS